ncbi:MAG: hypothetical protein ACFFFG_04605 [Candidatus Thorarchaeota archaeon]
MRTEPLGDRTSVEDFMGLWVVEKNSGIPICSVNLEDSMKIDEVLFGGFLAALRGMSTDLKIGELDSFQTKSSTLLMAGSGAVFSVLAITKNVNSEAWYSTLLKVQEAVEHSYTAYRKEDLIIDTTIFDQLKPRLKNIILTQIERNSTQSETFTDIKARIQRSLDKNFETGDLDFLFQYFPDQLGQIIYALLLEEPVILYGQIKEILHKVTESIALLVPHRSLKRDYATNFLDPKDKDLIICSSQVDFLRRYEKANITRVDVDNRKIYSHFKNTPSVDNLIHTLQIAPEETHETVLHGYIGRLMTKSGDLIRLVQHESVSKEEIQAFRRDLKADELNVILSKVRKAAPLHKDKLFHFARSIA